MSDSAEHIAVLSNPRAGKGRGAAATRAAVEQLRASGAQLRLYEGDSTQATRELAATALGEGPRALVVVGGDGTMSCILEEVAAGGVPVVLVPAGTGNDLARALGLPRDDAAAAGALALSGVPRVIDLGQVRAGDRTTLFLTVAALGFDAKVSDRTNRLRWPRGRMRYYLALLIELGRLRPTAFRTRVDDGAEVLEPGTLVAVGNTASYGGGMPVCVGARPDDGLLDVVHVAGMSRARLLRLFPLLLRGAHLDRPEVSHRRVREIAVSAPDLVVYADGERVAEGACVITARREALTVLVPRIEDEHG